MIKAICIVLCIIYYCSTGYSQTTTRNVELLFIGLDKSTSPAVSNSMDKLLRTELQSTTGITLTDYVKTTQFRSLLQFPEHPTLSKDLLATLEKMIPDSLLIMWGSINEMAIIPLRKHFFGCILEGQLQLSLSIYNITERRYLYNGIVSSHYSQSTHQIFFGAPEKVFHISTSEQNTIRQKLMEKTAFTSIGILKSLLRSNRFLQPEKEITASDTTNSPSIRDVFTIPSIQAQEIKEPSAESGKTENRSAPKSSTSSKTTGIKKK